MSVELVICCDSCPRRAKASTGRLRAHQSPPGWSRGRGVDGKRRLRLDWCPACSRARAAARRTLRGRR